MIPKKNKVVIVMPAFNVEKTLVDTYNDIPKQFRKYIILVDNKSTDKTLSIASKLNIRVIKHKRNMGYGGNQKTGYKAALKLKPDVIAMLHPDHQYSPFYLGSLTKPILEGKYDFVFGSRIQGKDSALKGGMPKFRYYINRFFAKLQNKLLGENFSEYFSGFRAFSSTLLNTVPFENFSDDFLFDQEMTLSVLSFKFKIGEIPIPTHYDMKSSSMSIPKGLKFVLETFKLLFTFKLHEAGLIKSKLFYS